MKTTEIRKPIVLILLTVALLVVSALFDLWLESLRMSFSETFDHRVLYLSLWVTPAAWLLAAIGWLLLFRWTLKNPHRMSSLLLFIVGIIVVFLPSMALTFGFVSEMADLGIAINAPGSTLMFFSGAASAAIGILDLVAPNKN